METKIEFTSAEKRELRKLYSYYKSAESREERLECSQEFKENYGGTDLHISELPEYIYSPNQLAFIEDAQDTCYEIDYGYSGRGMYGDVCPCIICESHNDITTAAKTQIDSMGLGIVIYAQF